MKVYKRVYFNKRDTPKKFIEFIWNQFLEKELIANNKILDIGCGVGSLGKYKPTSSVLVYGVDIDEAALQKAKKYELVYKLDLEKDKLPFEDDFFDACLARDILEHLIRPEKLVGEIFRVLKKGRIVLASVPMPKPKIVWNDYTHVRGFTKNAIRGLFKDFGFNILDIYPIGGYRISSKLGIVNFMPKLMKMPFIDRLAVSYFLKAMKPK